MVKVLDYLNEKDELLVITKDGKLRAISLLQMVEQLGYFAV